MTDHARTSTEDGSKKTALRRKLFQATIAAAQAEGPPRLTQNELRSEFGSACRILWEEGHTAEGVAERYIARVDGASVRLKKQIRADVKQLWNEFDNGTWRPVAAGHGARGGQSSQNADETEAQEDGDGERQEKDPAIAEVGGARASKVDARWEQPTQPKGSSEHADGAPGDPAPERNEGVGTNGDGDPRRLPDLAPTDTAGEGEERMPDDEEDAEALALRQELEHAAHEARRAPGYGLER
ncbi:MAG: hypothetical protein EOP23_21190 [Hyphomicrobiales bacterium]|nr:MAG: hypothetical protein EOP23_21190 [Hyphomicrobiales bacterium]